MNIKEKFGFKVKQLREQKSFSIEYLANISNVDRTYIFSSKDNFKYLYLLEIKIT
jgi:hypothetical protein